LVFVGVTDSTVVEIPVVSCSSVTSLTIGASMTMLLSVIAEVTVDNEVKMIDEEEFRAIFSTVDLVEIKYVSLLVVEILLSWTLDVSTTVDSAVVTLSSGANENTGSLVNPIVDVNADAAIEDELVSVTTSDSDIFGVSATKVVLNGAEVVDLFELLKISIVALSAI
jgi:hypothetical protein